MSPDQTNISDFARAIVNRLGRWARQRVADAAPGGTSAFDDWHSAVHRSYWGPTLFGLTILFGLVSSFGLWASTAPLASATVAQGVFVATGTNKTIQHLEGGIIRQILVEEGSRVEAGQPLVKLSSQSATADLARLNLQYETLKATLVRLRAEQDGAERMRFPVGPLEALRSPKLVEIVASQRKSFQARKKKQDDEVKILSRRIAAIKEEILGLEAQKEAATMQLELINEELAVNEGLMKKGLARLPAVLQLRRAKVKLKGEIGQHTSSIGQARQRILEAEAEILSVKSRRDQEIADEYRDAQAKYNDVSEQRKTARDSEARLTVTAPVRGIIIKRYHHTPGGIVGPGEKIMEILPTDDKLLVEAYVRPQDIDSVRRGLAADLRLTALNQRTTPVLSGVVTYVSADTIEGKQQGEIYYIARISISEEQLKRVEHEPISPGMPCEVYIKTGARTLVEYIVRPVSDSFNRAFREE